ncbi:MAG: hypothetical protein AAFP82_09330 [Bacteroidota bacterium]
MFITSISFAVDMHYCKGELKSFSLFGKAKSCHEKKATHTCPYHAKMQQQQDNNNCCENETAYVQADIDKVFSSIEFTDIPLFIAVFVQVSLFENNFEPQVFAFEHYKPPLIERDIPILVQSFLL